MCAETLNSGTNTTNATHARRTLIELTLEATAGAAPASSEAVSSRAATLGLIVDAPDEMEQGARLERVRRGQSAARELMHIEGFVF